MVNPTNPPIPTVTSTSIPAEVAGKVEVGSSGGRKISTSFHDKSSIKTDVVSQNTLATASNPDQSSRDLKAVPAAPAPPPPPLMKMMGKNQPAPPPPPPSSMGSKTVKSAPSTPSQTVNVTKSLPYGPPQLREDAVLKSYIAQGVPRGAVKNISDEGFAALEGLAKDKGDPKSSHLEQLKAEIGPKANIIRAIFAQGTPHVQPNDESLVMLGKMLNEGFKSSSEQTEGYKNQMTKVTDGKWEPYVEAFHKNMDDNVTRFPHCLGSETDIAKLPDDQQVALSKYTQEKYIPYNRNILFTFGPSSKGPDPKVLNREINGLCITRAAIEALPKVPSGTVVYRGDDKQFYGSYTPGAIITRDGFTSTAASTDSKFVRECNLTIKTRTGRDISASSLKPDEKEILIPPGATFRVVDRTEDPSGKLFINLEEI